MSEINTKTTLGQFFTPENIVQEMVRLIQNTGSILEPSCGSGHFLNYIKAENTTGLELDPEIACSEAIVTDFFDWPLTYSYDTIIGNPPYVKHNLILANTQDKLKVYYSYLDRNSNLYLYFIAKAVQHLKPQGELIFITPREWLSSTSARKLLTDLHTQGSFTYSRDLGDKSNFIDANPNLMIWRWQKDNKNYTLSDGRRQYHMGGKIFLSKLNLSTLGLKEYYDVKVGAASGCNKLFTSSDGDMEFVCSKTITSGQTRTMFYNQPPPTSAKATLEQRPIARQTGNWASWIRRLPKVSSNFRIYVNTKTRQINPFFHHPCLNWDESVLALIPKNNQFSPQWHVEWLNNWPWEDLGFKSGGRYMFSQSNLANCLIPQTQLQLWQQEELKCLKEKVK